VCFARSLAARHAAPLVYLGEQKRFPDAWFDLIVSPVPDDPRSHAIVTEVLPTAVSPRTVAAAAAKRDRPAGVLWAMIVGGSSRSHRYRDADWIALARGMNELAAAHGIRWLLSTSRRTGARAEALMRHELRSEVVADAIWWSQAPRRELHAFLGLADRAFVTQDSATMVCEAVASGRPVVALRPGRTRFPSKSFLPAMFDALEARKRIVRATAHELARLPLESQTFHPVPSAPIDAIARAVAHRLGWIAPYEQQPTHAAGE
jgi:mitochondrial fission protein ELM1